MKVNTVKASVVELEPKQAKQARKLLSLLKSYLQEDLAASLDNGPRQDGASDLAHIDHLAFLHERLRTLEDVRAQLLPRARKEKGSRK